jgi:hypothetical protein
LCSGTGAARAVKARLNVRRRDVNCIIAVGDG